MSADSELKLRILYANLMEEIKVRLDCINAAMQGRLMLPSPIVREFCYLQIRFLCELVALSCLIAHGDMDELNSDLRSPLDLPHWWGWTTTMMSWRSLLTY